MQDQDLLLAARHATEMAIQELRLEEVAALGEMPAVRLFAPTTSAGANQKAVHISARALRHSVADRLQYAQQMEWVRVLENNGLHRTM